MQSTDWAAKVAHRLNRTLERRLSVRVSRTGKAHPETVGMEPVALKSLEAVRGRTMTDPLQQYATFSAARYVAQAQIPGAVVECGVWRGGASMLMLLGLLAERDTSRELWLYDTFGGMTPPSEHDVLLVSGARADALLESSHKEAQNPDEWTVWCVADQADVMEGIAQTQYPMSNVHPVAGPVEVTLLEQVPEIIAIARLDTDWYESTKVELEVLFDRISPGGVLIIDDYDDWAGARQAVDEFFESRAIIPFLVRAGYGRVYVKPSAL